MSLKEFDQTATKFDDNAPSVYNMCRKDYPDVLAETAKEPFSDLLDAGCGTGAMLGMFRRNYPGKNYTGVVCTVLRPGGRLILRDMASKSRLLMWLINHIEIPVINKVLKKGDVHVYSRDDIQQLCDVSGLKPELYEVRKGFRLHCVVRNPW